MARRRRQEEKVAQRLILDSGAVIALSRGDARARAFLARALEVEAAVDVPVVVLAETLRGGPADAPVERVLNAVGEVPDAKAAHGRIAGRLLGRARSTEAVDALVVAHAVATRGGHILTSDPADLRRLAAPHPEVSIHAV